MQEWDKMNALSKEKTHFKKGKVRADIRAFGWHLYSNGSFGKNNNVSMLWVLSYSSYMFFKEHIYRPISMCNMQHTLPYPSKPL